MRTLLILVSGTLSAAPASILPARTPYLFEPNRGQTGPQVLYWAHSGQSGLWLTQSGIALATGGAVLEMHFPGSRRRPAIEGENPTGGVSNYFAGSDTSQWRTHIPQFSRVRYRDLYPGIDLVFYGQPSDLEYDWVVSPGADPRAIRMAFRGASRIAIGKDGDLVLTAGNVEFRHHQPRVFQDHHEIPGRFARHGHEIRFEIDDYDPARTLTIDPVLTFSSYIPANGYVTALGVAEDPQGNVIVVGTTLAPDYPVKNALYSQGTTVPGPSIGFVTKLNVKAPAGSAVLWSTFLGSGSSGTAVFAAATDSSGDVYLTGYTAGPVFPLKNAFQSSYTTTTGCVDNNRVTIPCADAFATKLSSAGDTLIYSSFLGGSSLDQGNAIAVDSSGRAWIGGVTGSSDFPATNTGFQSRIAGSLNGFLTQVSADGSRMLYSTLIGGENADIVFGIAVDAASNVYAAGTTASTRFPVSNPFQAALSASGEDAFVLELNPSLTGQSQLVYSTYVGASSGISEFNAVALDAEGNIVAAGGTEASNYPTTPNAVQTVAPGASFYTNVGVLLSSIGADAMVTKLNPSAQGPAQLLYSTYLGGDLDEEAYAVAVDSSGRIVVAGNTSSLDFPTTSDALESYYSGIQVGAPHTFLSVIDPTKSGFPAVIHSTYFGGTNADLICPNCMALDSSGVVFAGRTYSPDMFTTANAYSKIGSLTNGAAYVARFDLSQTGPTITSVTNGASFNPLTNFVPGEVITFFGTGLGPAVLQTAQIDSTGHIASTLAGCQVIIDGTPAPLVYAWTKQTSAIVPYELASESAADKQLYAQVICGGVPGNLWYLYYGAADPGIFSAGSGTGQGAILNQDGSYNSAANPAPKGSIVTLFATGEGALTPAGQDGRIESGPLSSIPKPTQPVQVLFGGIAATSVPYAGVAPQSVDGLLQVNAQIPLTAPSGNVDVILQIGAAQSQSKLTVAVQ
jgi:uncharacterized protein (TIGR03437 family)